MYAQLVIVGNVGNTPEYRITPSGAQVCQFSVAVNRKWTKDGDKQEETTWFRVSTWGKLADICNEYVKKGMLVVVDSDRIAANGYTNKNGDAAASLDVTARNVRFGGRRTQGEQQADEIDSDGIPF